jgi:16S rRNA (guanine966-N2)-methyltransferase
MQIISGQARGVNLTAPPSLAVRPTVGRARKALFDSLGRFDHLTVVDLCSGSGALGLEAASRGAAEVFFVEQDRRNALYIEKNLAAVRKTGVAAEFHLQVGDALDLRSWRGAKPDIIFADPPYEVSAELWRALMANPEFRRQGAGARLVWELPDTPGAVGAFLENNPLRDHRIRVFGGTGFLIGTIPD